MNQRRFQLPQIALGALAVLGCFMLFSVMRSVKDMSSPATSTRFRGHLSPTEQLAASRKSKDITVGSVGPLGHIPTAVDISVVADLDKKSKKTDGKGKDKFYSLFRRGQAHRKSDNKYTVTWSDPETFETQMNEGGRGFELSALKWFQGHLYTADDRTGIIFELHNFRGSGMSKMYASAKYIITEGNGESAKGQKNEWITVKDGKMYIGSIGKEYTDNDGNIINQNNFWVAVVDQNGDVRHEDWKEYYARMRKALDCDYPSYVIHEAIEWSAQHRKWFVLPRRVSHEPYDDMKDEKKGSNHILIANEDFTDIDVRTVGTITPERGFSSFKFLPNTKDTVIIALKSMENEELQKQSTFVSVFNIDGKILMEETEIPGDGIKYEGLAMLNDWTPREIDFDIH